MRCTHEGLLEGIRKGLDIGECCVAHGNQPSCLQCPDCFEYVDADECNALGIVRDPELHVL